MTRYAAVLRTNLPAEKCPEDFLKAFSEFLSKLLKTDEKNVILELHTNVTLIRAGSCDKAMNVDIHHNSDTINKFTKVDIAEDIAQYTNEKLQISKDRLY